MIHKALLDMIPFVCCNGLQVKMLSDNILRAFYEFVFLFFFDCATLQMMVRLI